MSEGSAEFRFSDNLEEVRQNIQTNLRGIISDLNSAGGALDGKELGAGYLDGFARNLALEGTKIVQQVEGLANEIKAKLQSGAGALSLPQGGFSGALNSGTEAFSADGQTRIKEFLENQLKSLPDSVKANPQAQAVVSRAIEELYAQIAEQVRNQRTSVGDAAREAGVSPTAAVGGVGGNVGLSQVEQFFGSFIAEFRGGVSEFARDIEKFQAEGREVAERIRAAAGTNTQLSLKDTSTVAQGAKGEGPLANQVVANPQREVFAVEVDPGVVVAITNGFVKGADESRSIIESAFKVGADGVGIAVRTAAEEGARLIAGLESGQFQRIGGKSSPNLINPDTFEVGKLNTAGEAVPLTPNAARLLALRFQDDEAAAAEKSAAAEAKRAAELEKAVARAIDNEEKANAADNKRIGAEVRAAIAAESKAASEEKAALEAADNARRRNIATGDVAAGQGIVAGRTTFSSQGVTESATGKVVTDFETLRKASEALSVQVEKLAAAEEHASKTPIDGLVQGLFGAGGRKRTGGAQPVDGDSPLFGLFETAGVVAKYEVLGRGIASLGQAATGAVKDFADLDQSTRELNEVFGSNLNTSSQFITNLENIATSAGLASSELLKASAVTGAAFGGSGEGGRQAAAETAAPVVRDASLITGQSPGDSAAQLVAIGDAYSLTANQLGSVTSAVANARNAFGGNAGEIQKGLAALAVVGPQAGFSLEQLGAVVGKVQATTSEGGTQIASSLTRIFNVLGKPASRETLSKTLGIDLTGDAKNNIEQLAAAFPKLNESQRRFLEETAGGARGLRTLIPLLNDQPGLQEAYKRALDNTDEGQKAANASINSLAGQLRQFGADIKQIGLDIAKSGILDPLILLFGIIKPGLELLDRLVQQFDKLPNPIKGFIFTITEAVVAFNAFKLLAEKGVLTSVTGLGSQVGGILTGSRNEEGQLTRRGLFSKVGEETVDKSSKTVGIEAATKEFELAVKAGAEAIRAAEQEAADALLVFGKNSEEAAAAQLRVAEVTLEAETTAQAAGVKAAEARAAVTAADERAALAAESKAKSDASGAAAAGAKARADGAGATAATADAAATEADGAAKLEDVAATELDVRAKLASAGTSILGGAQGLLGGVASAVLSLPGIIAIAGGLAIKSAFDGEEKRLKAFDASDTAVARSGTGVDDLRSKAADLTKAQQDIGASSSGITGTIFGGLSELLGGQDRGLERRFDKSLSSADSTAADRIAGLQSDAKAGAGAFDLQQVGGVAEGFKNLAADGATAQQQLDALTASLGQVAAGASGAARSLLPGEAPILAAKAGAGIADKIAQDASTSAEQRNVHGGVLGTVLDFAKFSGHAVEKTRDFLPHLLGIPGFGESDDPLLRATSNKTDVTRAGEALKKVDFGQLGKDLTDDTNQAIKDVGLDQGPITTDKTNAAVAKLQQAVKDRLKKLGIDFAKDLPASVQQKLLDDATLGLREAIAAATGGTDGTITKDNLQAVLANAPQAAQQAGAAAGVQAALGQGDGINGSAVAAAQTNLTDLENVRAKAAALASTKPEELADFDNKILAAQLAVTRAQQTQIQALGDALKVLDTSRFNKSGLLGVDLTTAQSVRASEKDPIQQKIDDAKIKQIQGQQADQSLADAASAARAGIDSRAVNANAAQDVVDAQARLDEITAAGGTGQDLSDAQKKLNDSKIKYAQTQIAQANILAASQVAVGDKVGELLAQAAAATSTAAGEIGPQAAADRRAAAVLANQATLAADAQLTAQGAAKIDPRNIVADDKNTLAGLQRQLRDTAPGDQTAIANIQRQIAQQQIKVATDTQAVADAQRLAATDPRNTVGNARDAVLAARAALALQIPGTAAYAAAQRTLNQANLDYATQARALAAATAESRTDSRDTVGEARNKVNAAAAELKAQLPGTIAYANALKALNDARLALAQAATDLSNAARDAATFPGDALGAASASVQDAAASLKNDKPGTLKYFQDLKALRAAQVAYARAIEDAQNVQEALGSDQTNPVIKAQNAVDAARRKLADDRKLGAPADVIARDQLDLTAAQNNEQKTAFSQQLSDAQTNLQLHRISGAAYLQYLETLRKNILATGLKTRQQVDELNQVDQAILSANQQLQGQFNLGDIKVPTVFQERQQAALGGIDIKGTGDVTPLAPVDPLAQKATEVIAPLSDAIAGIKTDQAIKALADLQAQINKLTGTAGPIAPIAAPPGAPIKVTAPPKPPPSPVAGTTLVELQKLQAALTSNTGVYQRLAAINTPGFQQADEARLKAIVATDAAKLASDRRHHATPVTLASDALALQQAKNQLSSVTNSVQINGADITKVIAYLNTVLGKQAVAKGAPLTGRKL